MVDVPAFVLTCVAFWIAGCSAIAVGNARAGSPKYEGPYQGLTKQKEWDYSDHGVSWAMGKCNSGLQQSPIALPTEIKNNEKTFYYRYQEIHAQKELFNDGYMFSLTPDVCTGGFGIGESTLIDGQPLEVESKYSLALVVFHSPSEHTWGGDHLPLEVQLIHRKSDDAEQQAIVSIGFNHAMDEIEEHPFLAALLEKDLSVEESSSTDVNKFPEHSLDFGSLIDNGNMWTYDGSMTVPSCKPNAKWFVRQHYHEAPEDQIKKFTDAVMQMTSQTGNNRVIQPLNKREVTLMKTADATTMKTVEEKMRKATQSAAPTVAAAKDPDDEDAVQSSSTVHVDPELDEGFRKEQKKEKEFVIKTAEQILTTFSRKEILHYPDDIKDSDQLMIKARATVQSLSEERDATTSIVGEMCDYTPETETAAKITSCKTAKSVADAKEEELKAAQKILDDRTVKVDTEIRAAQAEEEKKMENEAKQTAAASNEKTLESVPKDVHQLKVAVPQGDDVNDPFSIDCAETTSRIDDQNPMVAEQLTPSLDQSAAVPGIHFTESDEGDPDVMAPADGEEEDEATGTVSGSVGSLFLQARRGGKKLH